MTKRRLTAQKLVGSAAILAVTISTAFVAGGSGADTTTTTTPASTTSTLVPTNVNIVGYSVIGPAYKALESAFQATSAGALVSFTNSFGSSDTLTQSVASGQAADIVNLSYEPNIATLVSAGKVPSNWASQELTYGRVNVAAKGVHQQSVYPTPGILTDSVVVFVVRKGNPLRIANWSSLVKRGVQIVTPSPQTSGSAKWNILAGYVSQTSQRRTDHQAQNYLRALIAHTVAQPSSGSSSLAAFLAGTGNVLLSYEDDALAAVAAGDPVQIVTPPQTLLIENPIALTTTGIANPGARAFYKYLFSAAGQGILASLGYRSVLSTVWNQSKNSFGAFTRRTSIFTVTKINKRGWSGLIPQFFSSTVTFPKGTSTYPKTGIVTYLEKFAGSAS